MAWNVTIITEAIGFVTIITIIAYYIIDYQERYGKPITAYNMRRYLNEEI
jgi:hypothetical protein